MPGAADAVADHEAVRERPVIMTAMGVDRKDLVLDAHQQDILIADMAEQHVVLEVAQRDA